MSPDTQTETKLKPKLLIREVGRQLFPHAHFKLAVPPNRQDPYNKQIRILPTDDNDFASSYAILMQTWNLSKLHLKFSIMYLVPKHTHIHTDTNRMKFQPK